MLRYNYGDKRECGSGAATPSRVAPSHRRTEMRYKSIPEFTPEQIERFWSKVEVPYQPSCCWVWTSTLSPKGYGLWSIWKMGNLPAHRIAYTLLLGPIPDGFQLDHLCRNRSCVNPDHLRTVTNRENVLAGFGHTAINARKTHCNRGHEYTLETTINERRGTRACRLCKRFTDAAYRARMRAMGRSV